MSDTVIRNMGLEIHDITTEYDGFFKIKKFNTSNELYKGGVLKKDWLVFERGDAVAVVLYKKDSREIILTRQYRAPTLRWQSRDGHYESTNDGQLDEIIAGMQRDRETPEDCAVREVWEEVGYILSSSRLERIASFYSSPGGTSERIFLYYAEVTDDDHDPSRSREFGGIAKDGEDILIRHIPVSQFYSKMLDSNTTVDAKVLIASSLIKERIGKIPTPSTQPARVSRREYAVREKPSFKLVLRTGNMKTVKDVDAWVNSENTDMEMDRFIGTSVSALIRYEGAAKDRDNQVIEDTIAEALRAKMRGRGNSHIGTVHDTTSGDLKDSNGVKRVFHVAAVQGIAGMGAQANAAQIQEITRKTLEAIEKRNSAFATKVCTSALLPMIGTGDQGLHVEVALPLILEGILEFFHTSDNRQLKAVHISAFRQHDADYARQFLDDCEALTLQTGDSA